MLLKTNGQQSSRTRTKHTMVRYYFIKDIISRKDLTVKHCPAEEIMAGHFTKLLQGSIFQKFRAEIQRIPADTSGAELGWDQVEKFEENKMINTYPSPKECVDKPVKEPVLKKAGLKVRYCDSLKRNISLATHWKHVCTDLLVSPQMR
jgi:hypothetical protein